MQYYTRYCDSQTQKPFEGQVLQICIHYKHCFVYAYCICPYYTNHNNNANNNGCSGMSSVDMGVLCLHNKKKVWGYVQTLAPNINCQKMNWWRRASVLRACKNHFLLDILRLSSVKLWKWFLSQSYFLLALLFWSCFGVCRQYYKADN